MRVLVLLGTVAICVLSLAALWVVFVAALASKANCIELTIGHTMKLGGGC